MGSFWRGLSGHDVRTIANMLHHSPAALIVVSQSEVQSDRKADARAPFEEFKRSLIVGGAAVALDRGQAIGRSCSYC